ncbi:MAG: DUF418 domain-containing protein [Solirubrobacterales bacterium]
MNVEPQPTAPRRIALVDGLRGFALLGILIVNITYFSTAYLRDLGLPDPQATSWLDDATQWMMALLFEYKFYILFSFLFGYSFVLQMLSAERQGKSFGRRMLRRLLGLFVIGSLHAVFLWHGDILTTYAVVGLFLLAMRGVSPNVAVAVGVVVLAAYAALWLMFTAVLSLEPFELDLGESMIEARDATAAYRGGFGDVLDQRLIELPYYLGSIVIAQAPVAFAMFLFGLAAAKINLFAEVARYRRDFKRALMIALPIGVVGAIAYAETTFLDPNDPLLYAGISIAALTAPFLTGSYVSIFVLASTKRAGAAVINALAPVGRMALSNYVLQSVLMGLVFFGYGLGYFGELGPFQTLLVALAIFATQIPISAWWLNRHTYGPLEWLLRAFTNFTIPAWRKQGSL